jgi:peptidoglycan L-alanyl-D-glutamate endopeptidase CwlK
MKKDQITLDRIKLLHPKLVDEVFGIYDEICSALTGRAMCRFAYTLRTFKEQADLFAIGRAKPGRRVTQAGPGLSMHNYGLAVDIVLIRDTNGDGSFETASWDVKLDADGDGKSDWQEIVTIFKEHGWTWGGDWKFYDAPHFEKPMGYAVRQLLDMYNKKRVDANNYVLI